MPKQLFLTAIAVFCLTTTVFAADYDRDKCLLVEAESFENKGGWVLDQQYMDIMGSPYLLAHGLGKPVPDATTTVTFGNKGTYSVWVRTRNWIEGPWTPPGRFKISIDGNTLKPTFGTKKGWAWQNGGKIKITNKRVEIRLIDLTGFDGRCDAIFFTRDDSIKPLDFDPKNPDFNRKWRNKLRGLPAEPGDGGKFDVVIVGAGITGCAAAIAADKQGLSVALINDRNLLGGNASSEIRVHTEGIYGKGKEILKKIDTEHWGNGSAFAIKDQKKREKAINAATGVMVFRPYRAYDVQMDGTKIVSVDACSTITGEALRIRSNIFIDCTGDGWIGYWAGAKYRYGRESKHEFGESWEKHGELWSPEKPDNRIMGSSLLWNSFKGKTETTFPEVPWALDVANGHSAVNGEWYWEYSNNDKHGINDAEEIRDHMLRAIYGSFYNAKKSGKYPNHNLKWVGYLNGKRESRRLIGDYIYTQKDAMSGEKFHDAVAEETRAIDVHYQRKLTGSKQDFLSKALFRRVERYYIPFRCLYSKNIDNLMMAGRCFSCSHIGLGGPRVMLTCGQMGIATGYAASLCKKYSTYPRGVYRNHIDELKNLVADKPAEKTQTVSKQVNTDGKLPNILFILADDLGYGDVACYNPDSKIPTPNLDKLASEGMRFTDAHSPSTVCTPTRYSILTGRMEFRTGMKWVFTGIGGPCLIEENRLTLSQMLRERGYATACFGKWHIGMSFFDKDGNRIKNSGVTGVKQIDYSRRIPDGPIDRGFDEFYGTVSCPTTDWFYAYIDGDRVPVPPTKLLDKSKLPKHPYANDCRQGMVAENFDHEEVDLVFLEKSKKFMQEHVKKNPEKPFFLYHSMQAVHLPSFPSDQFKGKTESGPHGDFIFEMDYIVGELLKTLKELEIDDNTIVMFASDNGPEVPTVIDMRKTHNHDGARPWRGVKRDNWEGGHRTPFIVRWPGKIKAGVVSDQLTSLTDVMATCAEITDTKLPNDAAEDSYSMLEVLLGTQGEEPVRDYMLQQTPKLLLSIREGDWKYLDHKGSGGNNYEREGEWGMKPYVLKDTDPDAPGQLYNLQTDPGETNNLYSKHPDIIKRLKTQMELYKKSGRSAPLR